MALFDLKNISDYSQIGIWKIEESIEALELLLNASTIKQNDVYKKLKSNKRKKEWLSTRILLQKMLNTDYVEIQYNAHQKPFLSNNVNISISHSKEYVAVLLSDTKEVGIDIQSTRKNIGKGVSVFMSPIELEEIGETNYIEKLHIYWCGKESLYKYVGNNKLNIYEHFKITSFQITKNGYLNGLINPTNKVVRLKYEISDLFYLVYTV